MNEAEWLACNHPEPILAFMRGKTSDRKYRLFVLNCCYQVRHLLVDKPYCCAVEIAEQFVDGLAGNSELAAARSLVERAAWRGAVKPVWVLSGLPAGSVMSI
jgi:hypothetical protein